MTKFHFLLRRDLVLLLLLVVTLVPVFQAAHMLTHVKASDIIGVTQVGGLEESQDGMDSDPGIDKICLDCLALTALSVILPFLLVYFIAQIRRSLPPYLISRRPLLDFSFPYLTRAPPKSNFPHP